MKLWSRPLALALLLILAGLPAFAATPVLVADFSPGTYTEALDPTTLAVVGDQLFFAGSRGSSGVEPWLSDGTAAGTRLLADLCPGACSSYPTGFEELGGELFFFARFDRKVALEVYRNGTVAEVFSLPGLSGAAYRLGSSLYFTLYDEASRSNYLHQSDGTAAGTRQVAQLCSGPFCGASGLLGLYGENLFFTTFSHTSFSQTLYRIAPGGLPEGLFSTAAYGSLRLLGNLADGRVFFAVDGFDVAYQQVWITDGSAAGTRRLDDGNPATLLGDGKALVFDDQLYFSNGLDQLVKTTGADRHIVPATELAGGDYPQLVAATSTYLYYAVLVGINPTIWTLRAQQRGGGQVALSSGDRAPTWVGQNGATSYFGQSGHLWAVTGVIVRDLGPIDAKNTTAVLGQTFLFVAQPAGSEEPSYQLWRSDGSLAGTRSITAELPPSPLSSLPSPYVVGQQIVADPIALPERRLFRVDPTTLLSSLVDARPLAVRSGNGQLVFAEDQHDHQLFAVSAAGLVTLPVARPGQSFGVAADGATFFADSSPGQEILISDGSAGPGTRELIDLHSDWTSPCPDCGIELPASITPSGNKLFFVGDPSPNGLEPQAVWVYDRSSGAAHPIEAAAGSSPFGVSFSEGMLLAVAPHGVVFQPDFQQEPGTVFFSDGDGPARPILRLDGRVSSWVAVGERVFLARGWEPSGNGLWVSDLTSTGTFALLPPTTRRVAGLTRVGDHVVYLVEQDGFGSELGFSDGTPAGTFQLDLVPGSGSSSPRNFYDLGDGRVVFSAASPESGEELWISDGTAAGTSRLTELAPGAASASPDHFVRWGNQLFFQADDGTTGRELWQIELPAAAAPCPADQLCLLGGRFEVAVKAIVDGQTFTGQRAFGAAESGIFTFFSANNWEFLVKVLDGCAINQNFWVYASAATDVAYELEVYDRASGNRRTYRNAGGQAAVPILDAAAFASCGLTTPAPAYSPIAGLAAGARRCADDFSELCLGEELPGGGGRFRVSAEWQTAAGSGKAQPVPAGSADSGLFTFFSASNWELMVKLLDGCALNQRHWFFAAGTTDVAWTLTLEDQLTGERKVYQNPLGQPSRTLTDTQALGGCGN